jgi:hypothetical protein
MSLSLMRLHSVRSSGESKRMSGNALVGVVTPSNFSAGDGQRIEVCAAEDWRRTEDGEALELIQTPL